MNQLLGGWGGREEGGGRASEEGRERGRAGKRDGDSQAFHLRYKAPRKA